ncbi:MAG: VTT domain-containing protein [Candidatus Sulfotelmatobacter sp.]
MIGNVFIQNANAHRGHGITAILRHLGALGLFSLAIIDSSPLPTFGGPDILTAILAASHRNPWYEYAAVATAGSVIGAYLTFRIARRAGSAYLQSKFGHRKLAAMLGFFHKWGTTALAVSTAVPLPLPTSVLFAAAGASNYSARRFVTVVTVCRSVRYTFIAIIADHYGRHFVRVLRHPSQYWGWLLLFAAIILTLILTGIALNRRFAAAPSA